MWFIDCLCTACDHKCQFYVIASHRICSTKYTTQALIVLPLCMFLNVIYASLCTSNPLPLLLSSNPQAYNLNMTYPRYMFLTYGWYEDRWFAEEMQEDNCTSAQRESVLQHTLAVLQDEFLTNLSAITDTGIVSLVYSLMSIISHVTNIVLESITRAIKASS